MALLSLVANILVNLFISLSNFQKKYHNPITPFHHYKVTS